MYASASAFAAVALSHQRLAVKRTVGQNQNTVFAAGYRNHLAETRIENAGRELAHSTARSVVSC